MRIPIIQADYEPTKVTVHFIVAATATRLSNRVWDTASTCDTPILILQGGNVDPAGSKRLFETIGSCGKRLSLFEHGRHELFNDLDQHHACFGPL